MAADITGRWATFDSASSEQRSIVEIRKSGDGFRGRIIELLLNPDDPPDPVCDLCSGTQHGQKLRGMEILFLDPTASDIDFKGKILDPEEGRFYKCVVTLDASGKRLSIHGYVGIPMLGRTEEWKRTDSDRRD